MHIKGGKMARLFDKLFLNDFIENEFRKKLKEKIERITIIESSDLSKITADLKAEFTIHPLVLKEPKAGNPIETKRERRGDIYTGFYETEQTIWKIPVTIPYEGNGTLFEYAPSSSTVLSFPESLKVNSQHISVQVDLGELDPDKYQSSIDKIVTDLNQNLPTINSEITPWNNELDSQITQMLEKRKQTALDKSAFMKKIFSKDT